MDSIKETAVTAYNVVTGTMATRLDQIPQKALRLFLMNRFHVLPIGDAPVLMNWCLRHCESNPETILSEKEYLTIIDRIDEPIDDRTAHFFHIRSRFKTKDFNAWISLNEPFQPVWRSLTETTGKKPVILTNKNREATVALCRHFGLEIDANNIYSGDNGATKIENMNRIMQRFRKSHYTFIDDSVKNLNTIDHHFNKSRKLVSLLLAAWGYSGPNDAAIAEQRGYHILTIDEFTKKLTESSILCL